jgi:hypothetical protein
MAWVASSSKLSFFMLFGVCRLWGACVQKLTEHGRRHWNGALVDVLAMNFLAARS